MRQDPVDHREVVERVMSDARLERWLESAPEEDAWTPSYEGPAFDISPEFVRVLMWLGALALVAVVVMLLLRLRSGKAHDPAVAAEEDPLERRARWIREQLALAQAAEARGDWHAALRGFWGALVVGLGQSRQLAFRPGWTCREMLARSIDAGRRSSATEPVAALLPRVEAMEFGDVPAGPEVVGEVAGLCRASLPAEWFGGRP